MSDLITLGLDGLIVVLLVGTIYSSSTLNARLKVLRDTRRDFETLIAQFDDATRRADNGVKTLQSASHKSGESLQSLLDRTVRTRDELSIMLESAENLARRLEAAAPQATRAAESAAPLSAAPAAPSPRSKAERDLLNAMKREG